MKTSVTVSIAVIITAVVVGGVVYAAMLPYVSAPKAPATVTSTVTKTVTSTAAGAGATATVTSTITKAVTQTLTKTMTVSAPTAPPKVITIKVWGSGSPADVSRVTLVEKAAALLNETFSAIGLNVRIRVQGQFFRSSYMDKLTAAFAAHQAPDIIAMKNLPALVAGGYVIPLDKYIKEFNITLEDVYPVLWRAVKYKGHIWGLPEDTEARPLYFRKDVLRKLGWSEDKINALPTLILQGKVTLMDLIKVAQEAMKKGLVKWGFYHRPNWGGTPFLIFYYQFGGIAQDPNTGKLVINKTAALKVLQLLYNMTQVYKVLPPYMIGTSWRKIHTDFTSGKVLFWFGGTWHWAEWQRVPYNPVVGKLTPSYEWKNIGFALVPAPEPGLKPMTLSSPYIYYVTSQSKYPGLAFLLIDIATSAPFDAIHAVQSGHLPVRMTTVNEPYYQKSKFLAAVSYMLKYTSFEPLHLKYSAWRDAFITAITNVEKGSMTPQAALNQMISTMKSQIGDQLEVVS